MAFRFPSSHTPEFVQFVFDHPWGLQKVFNEIPVFLLHSFPTILFHAHRALSHLVDLGSQRRDLCVEKGSIYYRDWFRNVSERDAYILFSVWPWRRSWTCVPSRHWTSTIVSCCTDFSASCKCFTSWKSQSFKSVQKIWNTLKQKFMLYKQKF